MNRLMIKIIYKYKITKQNLSETDLIKKSLMGERKKEIGEWNYKTIL